MTIQKAPKMPSPRDQVTTYQERLAQASPQELLTVFLRDFPGQVTLASSLGAEDQVLTHMLTTLTDAPRVFVLDTGRLHEETYEVLHLSMKKYGIAYELFAPDTQELEKLIREKGPNSFYESVENRKLCCAIRKTHPLKRALADCKAWVTGLRQEQSANRAAVPSVEWDAVHERIKLNPLAHWTNDQVWDYINAHDVPFNYLHKKGYPSIGCAPCTRAIQPGEDFRAGRWWWESDRTTECGLHGKKES